jgi:hypothetical protein
MAVGFRVGGAERAGRASGNQILMRTISNWAQSARQLRQFASDERCPPML